MNSEDRSSFDLSFRLGIQGNTKDAKAAEIVAVEQRAASSEVFNVEVDRTHTYYVCDGLDGGCELVHTMPRTMVGFRVTKYDPRLRLPNGAYRRNEWTSVSDIGRVYDGRVVACSDYLRVETSYVLAVRSFLEASGLQRLRVTDLQVNDVRGGTLPVEIAGDTLAHAASVAEGIEVSGNDLDWVVRLALREAIWCRLKGDWGFYVHFGYDYYMYIGSEKLGAVAPVVPVGIYAEVFESPYHEEPPDEL